MRPSKTLLAALLVLVVALPVCAKKDKKKEDPAATSASGATTSGENEVMAYIGDQPITRAEVDKEASKKLAAIRQQEYDARREALDKLLQDRIYAKEAASRDMTAEDLVRTEVDAKVTPPTDEEVNKFYEENKARMGGRALEQVGNDIKNYLQQQRSQQRRKDFYREIMQKQNVAILLDPPRLNVPVREKDPSRGPKDAPVTIVEFSDFQCPFCKRAHAMVEEVMKAYPEKVRLVFRDYPLAFHPQATPAAEAAHCAGEQGKYWDYANHLMTVEGTLQVDDLKKRATDLGLDAAAFQTCIDGTNHEDTIKASFDEGNSLGVTGTPTFFINGRMLVGARPIEEIKAMIDEEIDRSSRKTMKAQVGG